MHKTTIRYTTTDGAEHVQEVTLPDNIAIEAVWIDGCEIPREAWDAPLIQRVFHSPRQPRSLALGFDAVRPRCAHTKQADPWYCTRDAGHDGPCALVELTPIGRKDNA